MENENVSVIWESLCDRIQAEADKLETLDVKDDGYKVAAQNFKEFTKLWVESERDANDFIHKGELLRAEEEERARKYELECRKLDIEERKVLIEEAKLEIDTETADKDLEMRKVELKHTKIRNYAELGISVAGLILSSALVMKTLNVNLEGIITDKDAVNAANKLFGLFVKRR